MWESADGWRRARSTRSTSRCSPDRRRSGRPRSGSEWIARPWCTCVGPRSRGRWRRSPHRCRAGRAAVFLGLDADRVTRWQGRRAVDRLADATPGGHPVHGLLAWERAAVLALFGSWGEVDRSHRKLAHRGSRLDVVHVSESTVRRVLMAEGLVLPGHPPREPTPRSPWPPWTGVETQPDLGLRLH